jgi:hypothetical protein
MTNDGGTSDHLKAINRDRSGILIRQEEQKQQESERFGFAMSSVPTRRTLAGKTTRITPKWCSVDSI